MPKGVKIDFVPDLPNSMRLALHMLDGHRIISAPHRQGYVRRSQFMAEGIEGIRLEARRIDEMGLNRQLADPEPDPRDPNAFYLTRIIINPWAFPTLNELQRVFNELFYRFHPNADDPHTPWPFRVQRIELAVDVPIEPEHAKRDVHITRGQVKHYQLQLDE